MESPGKTVKGSISQENIYLNIWDECDVGYFWISKRSWASKCRGKINHDKI